MLLRLYPCVGIWILLLFGCIYELMTWLLEVYAIFPLWCFIVEIFMHVNCELFEDVTYISWIFIIFAWFIALIEIGRYTIHLWFLCISWWQLTLMVLQTTTYFISFKCWSRISRSCQCGFWIWLAMKPTFGITFSHSQGYLGLLW